MTRSKHWLALFVFTVAAAASVRARAWDVACEVVPGVNCADPYARAQTYWGPAPRAEHRALLDATLELAGLPPSLRDKFTLNVFASDDALLVENGGSYHSVRPVLHDAARRRSREMSIPGMANLPDMSYALWDLAAGNELCPPDPSPGADALDCHNYETHIGWLNSNHMLPQSRRWYEHLHALALTQAAECRRQSDAVPDALRDRYKPYLLACEKQALMLEAVGHHYLQDSWSMGHLWERWGGTEEEDFDGDGALGFAVAGFTGLIHGGKAVFDESFSAFAPWDDPMCAPHDNVTYVDKGATPVEEHPGAGDIFLPAVNGMGALGAGDPFRAQRRALFGCAVDGMRAVYGATGRVHGALHEPVYTEFDPLRSVDSDSCWAQRATNKAIAEGCGIHRGEAPNAVRITPPENLSPLGTAAALQPLLMAELGIIPFIAGAPAILNPVTYNRFRLDASWACAIAMALALDPEYRDGTDLAEGGLPALAGIEPNHVYARGDPATHTPPAFWADPFPPWSLNDDESEEAPRKEMLNLFLADANAAQRCRDFGAADLDGYVAAVAQARNAGADSLVVDARCGQCVQLVAPHLRHGVAGNYDTGREAFCGLVASDGAAFLYTEEDPGSFTGPEPLTFAALEEAARTVCGCEPEDCGNACDSGTSCDSGICSDTCQNTDLDGDEDNCGSCGNACDYGYGCLQGLCTRVCPGPDRGGNAYYIQYPCGDTTCNCQLEACIAGACYAWSGPYVPTPSDGAYIPDSLPPEPIDGYCPTHHPWASRTQDIEGVFIFRCCNYEQTDCVCPEGIQSGMQADGYCHGSLSNADSAAQ
jgi:hypothetical protein